jgi:hypothetical protein
MVPCLAAFGGRLGLTRLPRRQSLGRGRSNGHANEANRRDWNNAIERSMVVRAVDRHGAGDP